MGGLFLQAGFRYLHGGFGRVKGTSSAEHCPPWSGPLHALSVEIDDQQEERLESGTMRLDQLHHKQCVAAKAVTQCERLESGSLIFAFVRAKDPTRSLSGSERRFDNSCVPLATCSGYKMRLVVSKRSLSV